jgi:hypothetical protein
MKNWVGDSYQRGCCMLPALGAATDVLPEGCAMMYEEQATCWLLVRCTWVYWRIVHLRQHYCQQA